MSSSRSSALPTGRRVTLRTDVDLRDLAAGWFSTVAVGVSMAVSQTAADPRLLGLAFTQFALPVVAGPYARLRLPPGPEPALTAGARPAARHRWRSHHAGRPARPASTSRSSASATAPCVGDGTATSTRCRPGSRARSACTTASRPPRCSRRGPLNCSALPPRRRDANPHHLTPVVLDRQRRRVLVSHRAGPHHRCVGHRGRRRTSRRWCAGARGRARLVVLRARDAAAHRRDRLPGGGAAHRDDVVDAARRRVRHHHRRLPGRAWPTPPLVIHSRHISPSSPYLDEGDWWVDALAAQPVDPQFFRRWFDDAVRWGVCCIEQDWMLMYWFGVRALRAGTRSRRARGRTRSTVTPTTPGSG